MIMKYKRGRRITFIHNKYGSFDVRLSKNDNSIFLFIKTKNDIYKTILKNIQENFTVIGTSSIKYIDGDLKTLISFFSYLIKNGWTILSTPVFDNVPLECSICSTSKNLKECECCEQIYCSVNCQIKNH